MAVRTKKSNPAKRAVQAKGKASFRSWPHLQPGDIVDVIAPSGASKPKELRNGIKYLKSLGLIPRVPKDILRPQALNLANTDEKRFKHLKAALLAKDSKAIWCLRGGYGVIRLVPQLQKLKRPKHSKAVLGFSDITTLHSFLNQTWHWPVLHAPTLTRMGGARARPSEKRELRAMLFGKQAEQKFVGLKALNKAAKGQDKKISAPVVGGNLTVLVSSLGTSAAFSAKGKIIFFEDVSEKPYRVDRMLEQMTQAGVFKQAKAVILGTFTFDDKYAKKDARILWRDVIPRFADGQKIPVLSGLRVGHGPQQHTLPLQTWAKLNLGRQAQLVVQVGWK